MAGQLALPVGGHQAEVVPALGLPDVHGAVLLEHDVFHALSLVYDPVWHLPAERESLSLRDADITSIVWCIGFSPDFRWLDAPVFNGRGHPIQTRGITSVPGPYFIGLPWLHTWGSGRFSGVARDAEFIVQLAVQRREVLVSAPVERAELAAA